MSARSCAKREKATLVGARLTVGATRPYLIGPFRHTALIENRYFFRPFSSDDVTLASYQTPEFVTGNPTAPG
jgi:hypothetical protein